ncbi:MAG: intradiol ring-cleavage dioxygenase [Archangium sp.]
MKSLAQDLITLRRLEERRRLLKFMAMFPLAACGAADLASTGSALGSCSVIPEETAGPYPGDGSNGVNALSLSGIVRSSIASSFGSMSGVAAGIPLTITLTLVGTNVSCVPLEGYAIYAWHCDRDGNYSLYTVANQNYLRGVQETDANGQVKFTTIFPGCYSGRWPHVHFEVYPNLASATVSTKKIKTSQLALPSAACNSVYATSGYESSVSNFAKITLASDNVFSDGTTLQVPTVTGDAVSGFNAALTVGIAA